MQLEQLYRARHYIQKFLLIWFGLIILAEVFVNVAKMPPRNDTLIVGTSFDPVYARYLGQNPNDTFTRILDDWHFRYIRIPLHWDQVEKERGVFSFAAYDTLMAEAGKRNAKIVLTIGQKTPRWPECHQPDWAKKLSGDDYTASLNRYIATAVHHFKNNPALEIWQVENEPFLAFGDCPAFTKEQLAAEVSLVRVLDSKHQTLVTDSGELSTWSKTMHAADLFGTTMYRVVWNKYTGYWSYDWLPAAFYRWKLALYGRSPATAFVVELQAEPWIPDTDTTVAPLSEQYKSMDAARLKKNVEYARQVGFARSYLWGAEWWVWLESKGDRSIVEYVAALPKE